LAMQVIVEKISGGTASENCSTRLPGREGPRRLNCGIALTARIVL